MIASQPHTAATQTALILAVSKFALHFEAALKPVDIDSVIDRF